MYVVKLSSVLTSCYTFGSPECYIYIGFSKLFTTKRTLTECTTYTFWT